ncbi:MAG: type II toxin-antitoxin system RelE/ParE family toxin [Magnetococcales bacterium]|nr:type II toxin-antitoxin system RelE/ParE family toxin [Magnetococcales bacterium]NGZ26135.1 type II toxin-antitoxin system RelE/ParE family toxin [Magnetococcales bacterium]
MADECILSGKTEENLRAIYLYSCHPFSEAQANAYLGELDHPIGVIIMRVLHNVRNFPPLLEQE